MTQWGEDNSPHRAACSLPGASVLVFSREQPHSSSKESLSEHHTRARTRRRIMKKFAITTVAFGALAGASMGLAGVAAAAPTGGSNAADTVKRPSLMASCRTAPSAPCIRQRPHRPRRGSRPFTSTCPARIRHSVRRDRQCDVTGHPVGVPLVHSAHLCQSTARDDYRHESLSAIVAVSRCPNRAADRAARHR